MPAFQYRHIKDLIPTFWSKSSEMVDAVTKLIKDEGKEDEGKDVEFAGWLGRCTLDIIGKAGLGYEFNAIQDPNNELNVTYRTISAPSRQAKILGLLAMMAPPMVPILRRLPLQRNVDVQLAAQKIRSVSRHVIEEKVQILKEKGTRDIDILSVALESGGFTVENLVDQTMTFLAAGHETTATATTWAVVALCQHPEIQNRLREEIRAKLPSVDAGAEMTAELIEGLPYLHAVCNEVLRYYAPVHFTRREAIRDTTILDQVIPKGTQVVLIPAAINLSKELWGEDADKFNPERWLAPKQANSGGAVSNYANLTFLHGMIGPQIIC